ncbi:MAG: hypothetical protein FWF54_10360 [Candidatus Azobacteroides sp.]|nr:hypothetical protein [Candidatus Azobacteroides sp.]
MKNKLFIFLPIVIMTMGMITCCSTNKIQVYRFLPSVDCDSCSFLEMMEKLAKIDSSNKFIILRNDSILGYSKRYVGLYSNTAIKYIIVNDELITDSINLYGYEIYSVTNVHFLYSRDSLVNKVTNEKYYNQKYLDKIRKK